MEIFLAELFKKVYQGGKFAPPPTKIGLSKGGLSRNWRKIAKMGGFPPKFIIKVGMTASSVIRRGYLSEKRAADPPSIHKSCTPPPPPPVTTFAN